MAETKAAPRGRRQASEESEAAAGPQPCSACRATGQVISGRGGEPTSVPCPWCQGTGQWEPGFDAQANSSHPGA